MKKRITFSANKKSTIDAIDDYSNAKGYSRSEVISFLLNATAPALNKITSQYHIAQTLESTLGCIFEEKAPSIARGEPKLTYEEFFYSVWNTHIRHRNEVVDQDFYAHKIPHDKMGKSEKKLIHEKLSYIIKSFNVKKAIFIYTDRRVNRKHLIAGGLSNIILIKDTVYDGCFFDLSSIVIMPIFELITFGVEAVLKRNKPPPKQSCYCWIPIYYTNDLAVMVPVIAEGDTPQKAMKGGDAIIINPFNGEVNHTF
ncbi:hypothetical protein AWS52_08530 [Enterobacter cloacae subsp. cloacae]|uniref:hypothetical protein n=1 Tax=Enterobacter cloacae TaxID=550 RepID=UPI00076D5498|nr:hypothetical protein [Enterobacter cloacae]KVI66654.1 hypothetical protein AWS52_08530 [Enterobacter cloacae subsp. cloacae]